MVVIVVLLLIFHAKRLDRGLHMQCEEPSYSCSSRSFYLLRNPRRPSKCTTSAFALSNNPFMHLFLLIYNYLRRKCAHHNFCTTIGHSLPGITSLVSSPTMSLFTCRIFPSNKLLSSFIFRCWWCVAISDLTAKVTCKKRSSLRYQSLCTLQLSGNVFLGMQPFNILSQLKSISLACYILADDHILTVCIHDMVMLLTLSELRRVVVDLISTTRRIFWVIAIALPSLCCFLSFLLIFILPFSFLPQLFYQNCPILDLFFFCHYTGIVNCI